MHVHCYGYQNILLGYVVGYCTNLKKNSEIFNSLIILKECQRISWQSRHLHLANGKDAMQGSQRKRCMHYQKCLAKNYCDIGP